MTEKKVNSIISPSYIIYIDGNNVNALNGYTGSIDFSGLDFSKVINQSIAALANGGKIFIKAGLYDINSPIYLTPTDAKLVIEGEVGFVGKEGDTNTGATILRQNANINLFTTWYPNNVSNKTIRNLFLLGQAGTYTGMGIYCQKGKGWLIDNVTLASFADRSIHLRYTDYSTINNCTIRDGTHRGIQLSALVGSSVVGNIITGCRIFNQTGVTGDGIVLAEGVYNTRIENCYAIGNSGIGFYTENGTVAGAVNSDNSLVNCTSISNNRGCLVSYSNRISIIGCIITNNTSYGILGQASSKYLKIIGCTIEDNGGYGISRTSGDSWTIIGNSILNNILGQIQGYDSTSIVKNNVGYRTENNILSDSTFTIDSIGLKKVTFAHGLAITPFKKDCNLTVIQNTLVTDWKYDLMMVTTTSSTTVTAVINVSSPSTTTGATSYLGLRVGNP